MDRAELADVWADHKDRPAVVREHADAIAEHTSIDEPVPEGSLYEVGQWLGRYKGTVTRQLNDDTPGSDPHDEEDDGDE